MHGIYVRRETGAVGGEDSILFSPAYLIYGLVVFVVSIAVIVDVARFPSGAFKGTGLSKTSWIVLQVLLTHSYMPPSQTMPGGSFPRQPGYGAVPPGGYGAAPPGSQFGQHGAGQPPPAAPRPADAPRDAPHDWAPPPPPPS